jgi:hypothetical protein
MIKYFNNNIELYKTDTASYRAALEIAKKLPRTDTTANIHCFWRVPYNFERKQASALKSIIAHNPTANITLWSNVDLTNNEFFKPLSKYVNFKIWDVYKETKNTCLEDSEILSIHDNKCYLESDLFRAVVLYNYGGFYIDLDVMVLRDLSPLTQFEFIYQWSHFLNKPNNAVIKFDKKSTAAEEILYLIKNTPPRPDTTVWGSELYEQLKTDILMLPCVWFDSEWELDGNDCNPFGELDNIDLYDGAFTYHWHGRWNFDIHPKSKFAYLDNINDIILQKRS